jgi:competence protein ComEA
MRQQIRRVVGAFLILTLAGVIGAPEALAAAQDGGKVNINTANVDELTDLPGIGPAYARRIVDYREEHGPFRKIEDLLNVRGIGDRTFEKIRDRITVKGR